jgi:hypothetical protein
MVDVAGLNHSLIAGYGSRRSHQMVAPSRSLPRDRSLRRSGSAALPEARCLLEDNSVGRNSGSPPGATTPSVGAHSKQRCFVPTTSPSVETEPTRSKQHPLARSSVHSVGAAFIRLEQRCPFKEQLRRSERRCLFKEQPRRSKQRFHAQSGRCPFKEQPRRPEQLLHA